MMSSQNMAEDSQADIAVFCQLISLFAGFGCLFLQINA